MSVPIPADAGPAPAWLDRAVAGAVAAAALVAVVLLAGIDPDARGHGTHEQLGMRPCGWPERYGMPCPTCGVTTAACHLVHLSPWRAFLIQPFGSVLAVVGLWVAAVAVHDLARRRSFLVRAYGVSIPAWLVGGTLLMLAAWGYKVWTWNGSG